MIVLTNEFTALGNKEGFESLPQIVNSLSATPINAKKVRHSLKNLCFYPPSVSVLSALFDLFKRELKEQSRCFKLLCHHLITHAPLSTTSSQVNDIISTTSKLILDKKPPKGLNDLYRVFFNLCYYSQTAHSTLIDVISKILTLDLSFLTKKKKKSILGGSSHKSPLPDLILECLTLLVDIPNFANSVRDLLSKSGVIDGIINIFKSFGRNYKFCILAFLSSITPENGVTQVPPRLLDLLNPEDDVIDSAFTTNYLINHQEKFSSMIKQVLEKKAVSSKHYVQYRLLQSSGPTDFILSSITSQIEPNESSLLPLLIYLEKSPRGVVLDKNVLSVLYQACQNPNFTISAIAFMCVCFVSDEIDWICAFFDELMSKLSTTQQRSIALMVGRSWIAALDHIENKRFVRLLFEKLILQFGNSIDQAMFNTFIQKVVASGSADDFLDVLRDDLAKLPSIESVIYILFGAASLKKYADPQIFDEFQGVAKEYMETAGPAMLSFYEMTLSNQTEE